MKRKMKKVIRMKERLWEIKEGMDFGRGMNEELRMGLRVKVINGVWIVKGLWKVIKGLMRENEGKRIKDFGWN